MPITALEEVHKILEILHILDTSFLYQLFVLYKLWVPVG